MEIAEFDVSIERFPAMDARIHRIDEQAVYIETLTEESVYILREADMEVR